jgi:4-hydroxy-2-oxoheptanedioate aldolase
MTDHRATPDPSGDLASMRSRLASGRPQFGMWVASGSPCNAEICAGSGLDWLLVDMEHAPNDLGDIVSQLRATAAYPAAVVVRPPSGDPVVIKRLLDAGVRNLLVPMVDTAAQAEALVRAVRYPPAGMRGVGSTLARASGWGRDGGYLARADQTVTLLVQVESRGGLDELAAIATVDGVDGVLLGPADLAASLGHLGEQQHPEVVETVISAIATVSRLGRPAGVNAFSEPLARRYLAAGCRFILVGADVTVLAQGSDRLAGTYLGTSTPPSH